LSSLLALLLASFSFRYLHSTSFYFQDLLLVHLFAIRYFATLTAFY
jgi:hypothetical protein